MRAGGGTDCRPEGREETGAGDEGDGACFDCGGIGASGALAGERRANDYEIKALIVGHLLKCGGPTAGTAQTEPFFTTARRRVATRSPADPFA